MGRRAKYLTVDAKRAAKTAQARAYRKTEKGKQARLRQNKKQVEIRKASKQIWAGVHIPSELVARSQHIFRASFAIHGAGPLLGLWTPPYEFEMPDMSTLPESEEVNNIEHSWSSRAAILGAYQYGEVIEVGRRRFVQWSADDLDLDAVEAQVKQEVVERVKAWACLAETTPDGESGEVVAVALDWGAKIVRMLVEEWEVVKDQGVAGYREHRKSSSLPWQRLMKDTMRLFNAESC